MTADYVPGTPAGDVRMRISDVGTDGVYLFTDAEIRAFLAANGQRPKRAAADALETIASNEALKLKVIRTQDAQTDGAKLADALRANAAALRQSDADDLLIEQAASGSDVAYAFPSPGCGPELAHYGYGWSW